jgi:thiol:disulfide interchange protein DsbC
MRAIKMANAMILMAVLALSGAAAAADAASEAEDMERILEAFPELEATDVRPAPMPGMYEISLGSQMGYISADAQYLIQGDLFDVESERNLTEERRMVARLSTLESVGTDKMIIFEPEEATHTITVFTDIDCGYCRKLHRQIEGYNELGIRVRYLFFPRSGPETSSWFKAEQVWCAEDRNSALTLAKSGGVLEVDECDTNPVAEHYQLGRTFGISGTPAIIVDTGQLIPGYVSPNELVKYLDD